MSKAFLLIKNMLGGSQEPLTATSPRSLGQSNNALRLNPAFADVVLLVGETQKEVYAHAAILAQNCEYYNRALADRWTSTDTTPLGNKTFRAVLTHPDVTVDVLNIVLEFIYTGTTKVPDEHITSVCLFADQLVLPLLVDQCIKHYTDYLLCPNNAFDFYVLCHKLSRDGAKGAAILTVLDGFNEAIQHGGHAILELGDDELRRVLMFHMLTPEQRWRIVIAWVKLRQGVEDVALEHGLGDDFNLEHGREDVKDLIPFVGYSRSQGYYTAYVVPYLDILEDGLVALLKGHFVPLVIQGNETWGADLLPNSAILNRSSFQTLCNLVNSNIKLITPTETKLLFRASEHGFSNAKFHQQCDGKGDLFVLIKTAGGELLELIQTLRGILWVNGFLSRKPSCFHSQVDECT
ncbi:POZ domain-containing protein [Rhizoclosmatium globosum]|uniref:POZ domain-containing protein n=1 Tax=Rhizoclosmatium globosum TaxID=329046 RepID=A0A1Y2CIP8_9FUNG|nr:POZ domain-containing protein [Rhizoclosmatium globosum]|eukprot:ORY46928.1 POZ domain-containing protein [Rhizoclosmatium globosum]